MCGIDAPLSHERHRARAIENGGSRSSNVALFTGFREVRIVLQGRVWQEVELGGYCAPRDGGRGFAALARFR
jgi:hypothetical protein